MLNNIIIHGRLVRDPELRRTQSGKAVTQFCIAVDRNVKNQDGSRSADFIDCVAWEKIAEHVEQYYRKGQEIIVSGRLESRDWTDKQGNKRRSWEINVERTEFCGKREESYAPHPSPSATPSPQGEGFAVSDFAALTDDDSELPF